MKRWCAIITWGLKGIKIKGIHVPGLVCQLKETTEKPVNKTKYLYIYEQWPWLEKFFSFSFLLNKISSYIPSIGSYFPKYTVSILEIFFMEDTRLIYILDQNFLKPENVFLNYEIYIYKI